MFDVDCRWASYTGIGRYCIELTKLVQLPHYKICEESKPNSLIGMTYGLRKHNQKSNSVYSPGFMAILGYKRQIITLHDLIHLKVDKKKNPITQIYYRDYLRPNILKRKIHYVVNSRETEIEVCDWLGDEVKALGVVEPALSEKFVTTPKIEKENEIPTLIIVANDSPHKNIQFFLRSIELIDIQVRLITVGIKNLINCKNPAIKIEQYYGVSEEKLIELYDSADYLCVPSLAEGYCIPVIEAKSRGVPIIHLGLSNQVNSLVGNWGVKPDDPFDPKSFAICVINAFSKKIRASFANLEPVHNESWHMSAEKLNKILFQWSEI